MAEAHLTPIEVGLTAAIVAVEDDEPRILVAADPKSEIRAGLPFGPFDPLSHRTFESGLRAWVAAQTAISVGYVEQLYTFGDRDRQGDDAGGLHSLSVAYLALVREVRPGGLAEASWRNWYRYLPWEDWREGRPESLGEIETQHNTLTAERDDLVEAIKRLRQGIISLNKEARERLLSSFANVNTQFQRLFTELFGGGTAELQLIEAEDPLEAGLEILAKPPGKKPATLSLLSGGEQALTALALIFAVFLTNPAPICVLDEVDAPLDDHNVERFCDLLDEMGRSTDTRFVIITHNPITMARMNRLFGVTMAERGVSQLVSVDLEAAVRIRDSAA